MPVSYPGVYIEEVPSGGRTITGVDTSITAFVGCVSGGPVEKPVDVYSFAEFEKLFGGLSDTSPLSFAVMQFFQNGGRHAIVVRVRDSVPVANGKQSAALLAGLQTLDSVNLFNLLCVLPAASDQDIDGATWVAAIACTTRRRAIVLVDAPVANSAWTKTSQVTREAIAAVAPPSPNAALYYPRVQMLNALHANRPDFFAPCGAVAGVIAKTDAERGVWKSPAGLEATLRGVVGLERNLTDREHGPLNQLGVNCLRMFPNTGAVVWGARTIAGADGNGSEWKYLPVRRLALFIEESIDRGTKWVVFEPNDEPLWANIRLTIETFLHTLFRQGAFQGSSPRQAYFVKCGRDTITQADIDAGIVNILVGFAPLKPAEFVVISIQQMATASSP
jgi:uncharacterized protein